MIAILLAGLLAGGIHVMSGPDHLAAVAPFAARDRRRAWSSGLRWGLGHVGGVAVLAGLALVLRDVIPVERIAGVSEQLVGFTLIAIGLWSVRLALRHRVHVHAHEHDGSRHVHVHTHAAGEPHDEATHRHGHAPMWIGALHGLAGTTHLLGILPALALPGHRESIAYLAGYGLGTVGAMFVFSILVGTLAMRVSRVGPRAYRAAMVGAGALAVVVGGFWLA